MNLFSLEDIRSALWRYGPVPKVTYSLATNAQKTQFTSYLNQVCERLLGRMKPRYTMRRVNVPIYDGTITVPRELDGIVGIELVDAYNCPCRPLQIYSRFHEWAHAVPSCSCSSVVFVLSDMVQCFQDPSPSTAGYKLRVKSTEGDTPDMTFEGGYNADWEQVFSTETLTIGNGTFTTTSIWNSMPLITKPVTDNLVELYSVDVASSEETLIAVYAPVERKPAYKRYKVPEWYGYTVARIFGKLAFNEVSAESDVPIPNNLGALKAGLQALAYEDAADLTRSDLLWNRAYAILDEEQAEAGDAEMPVFKVDPDFGAGAIPQVM